MQVKQTRQLRRQAERAKAKAQRRDFKVGMMKHGTKGGSARYHGSVAAT